MRLWHTPRDVLQDGRTVLMEAARGGHADVTRLLQEHGADIDDVDKASAASGSFAE